MTLMGTRTLLVAPGRHGAFPTIGEALSAAPDGGVITIAEGTYTETFELFDRRLAIHSFEGAEVILDGTGGDWPVLRVRGGSLTLHGIELRASSSCGAAIQAEDVDLTVERCTVGAEAGPAIGVRGCRRFAITRCTIAGAEQGIVVESSSGRIDETTVRDVAGDGIVIGLGADPELRDCTVTGCAPDHAGPDARHRGTAHARHHRCAGLC